MRIKIADDENVGLKPGQEPVLLVTRSELESRTFAATLCEIEVADGDKIAKFWVSARISNNGRVILSANTKTETGKEIVKTIAGHFRKQKAST